MPKTTKTAQPEFSIELAQTLFDSEEAFPVDFDDAWVWIGYSRKDVALRFFMSCGFSETLDWQSPPIGGGSTTIVSAIPVATPVNKYFLSIDCFKMFAMMARTSEGDQVRRYFIECEKVAKLSGVKTAIMEATIADLQMQLAEALKAPKPSTRTQQIVERPDPASYVQAMRCEANRIWADRGQRDHIGAINAIRALDAATDLYLGEFINDNSHGVPSTLSLIATHDSYKGEIVFNVNKLPDAFLVDDIGFLKMKHGKNAANATTAAAIRHAMSIRLSNVTEDVLISSESVFDAIFTENALDKMSKVGYSPRHIIGTTFGVLGFEKITEKRIPKTSTRSGTQAIYRRVSKIGGAA